MSDITNMVIALGGAYLLLERLGGKKKKDKSNTELLKAFLDSNTIRSLDKIESGQRS